MAKDIKLNDSQIHMIIDALTNKITIMQAMIYDDPHTSISTKVLLKEGIEERRDLITMLTFS